MVSVQYLDEVRTESAELGILATFEGSDPSLKPLVL